MPVCSSREISMNGGGGALEAVFESSEVCLMIIFMKGGGGRHPVAILSFYTEYSLNCQSVCLFLATTGRSGNSSRFTVIFRLVFQLSICISVYLSVSCLFPSPNWGVILSIGNLYIYLSVPLAGRSRYIDISMIYILSKLRY